MPRTGSLAKKAGIGLFLFFFIKGMVWLVIFGAAIFGATKI